MLIIQPNCIWKRSIFCFVHLFKRIDKAVDNLGSTKMKHLRPNLKGLQYQMWTSEDRRGSYEVRQLVALFGKLVAPILD